MAAGSSPPAQMILSNQDSVARSPAVIATRPASSVAAAHPRNQILMMVRKTVPWKMALSKKMEPPLEYRCPQARNSSPQDS
jgi:hypothetical protein